MHQMIKHLLLIGDSIYIYKASDMQELNADILISK